MHIHAREERLLSKPSCKLFLQKHINSARIESAFLNGDVGADGLFTPASSARAVGTKGLRRAKFVVIAASKNGFDVCG